MDYLILFLLLFLIYKANTIMANQADLQAALDAQAGVISKVEAEVAVLQSGQAPAVDLAPQVAQVQAQTARLEALVPAVSPPVSEQL